LTKKIPPSRFQSENHEESEVNWEEEFCQNRCAEAEENSIDLPPARIWTRVVASLCDGLDIKTLSELSIRIQHGETLPAFVRSLNVEWPGDDHNRRYWSHPASFSRRNETT
jgi:hypothetical protein